LPTKRHFERLQFMAKPITARQKTIKIAEKFGEKKKRE
jgi:hypothetical protein